MDFEYAEESLIIDFDTQKVEALFKKLAQKKLPWVPPLIVGMNGTFYTLKISNGLNNITYEWWVEIPAGFEVLEEIRDKLFSWAGTNIKDLFEFEE